MPSVDQLRSRLLKKLSELFQLDQPDLDFGFYRIMHAKAQEVQVFIGTDLLKIVADAFGDVDEARKAELQAAYEKAIQTAKDFGAPNPEETEPVKKAKATLDAVKDTASAEADVYDHLYRFFERYYDDGDFISRRYYTRETSGKAAPFAVPYNGEEVKLHWANADQYYIKSAEYFSNFTFDLRQARDIRDSKDDLFEPRMDTNEHESMKVHFRVVEATEGEHGNVKASEQNKRFFIIHKDRPVEFNEAGELVCNFEYRPDPEKTGQEGAWRDKRNAEAVEAILDALESWKEEPRIDTNSHESEDKNISAHSCSLVVQEYFRLFKVPAPTDSDKKRPVLAKYVNQYTARNTMDYFIHKDLGGFLRRELDFYIKNEVMRLDDIENAEAPAVESYLAKIKVLRKIAGKLIDFLAQLEDFQKKLWLKKKFIIETNYCITLDRVPEELYPEIAENEAQIDEWVKLFAIDEIGASHEDTKAQSGDLFDKGIVPFSRPLTVEFLKANNKLVLDTRFFDDSFKALLVASIENFDEQCDGLLINGDNFQGMTLIGERYAKQIRLTYIDPPYNTGGDDFMYKDAYQHSSWLSFIQSRVCASIPLLAPTYNYLSSIDDEEAAKLRLLFEEILSHENFVADVAYERSGSSGLGQGGKIVNTKEHILVYSADKSAMNDVQYEREIEFETLKRYNKILTNAGDRELVDSFVAPSTGEDVKIYRHENFQIDTISLRNFAERKDEINREYVANFKNVFRLTSVQKENEFQNRILSLCKNGLHSADYLVSRGRFAGQNITLYYFSGQIFVWLRDSAKLDGNTILKGNKITDHWSHGEIPKADLANEGGVTLSRGKKPEQLMKRLIEWCSNEREFVLDYFAGSGSTAAAATKLRRKFIAIDAEKYFDDKSVLRIKNVFGGDKSGISKQTEWKGGGLCKYIRLESYEDTLNNLRLDHNPQRKKAVAANPAFKEDYMLRYLLDVETRGSQSLLNIDAFADPTAYTLEVKKPGTDEYATRAVDLIETFNYLIGLRVLHSSVPQTFHATFKRITDPELPEDQHTKLVVDGRIRQDEGGPWWFRKVEGWVPKDAANPNNGQREKVLVVWRKLTDDIEQDNLMLDEWFQSMRISTRVFEFDTIYVNGSNNLPNLKLDDENWKVRLIEEEFMKRMWEAQ
ncbi:site-specific DNA-methyltransferase [Desulfurispirillum indicum]|uniref:DNA methyltransferase n=1 Tax=Desulfurispirillum indicum TaxID=936456 RepID=UPI001CFBF80E|nr:site-specific DNA-methyltransferase [Desulfurispirillum indicum]UCZ55773.1 site-specific DNA-methyltransferase [Desulfurispirillum indicum]